jgi:sugar phosphate isomerase/epimerase
MELANAVDLVHRNWSRGSMLSRRKFIDQIVTASSGLALANTAALLAQANEASPPIVVFSKVYQQLNLSFEEAARITAEAGLDGVDCPLRAGGEIPPEQAAEDLPRYVQILRKSNLQLPLLTTGITNSSPQAEDLLRVAKGQGIRYYRLGFIEQRSDISPANHMSAVKAQLKELVVVNKQLGMCGLLENHSPVAKTVYFGGNLEELWRAVEDFDPAQIGIAFDIGHALLMHGDDWRRQFDQLKSHFKIAYVKDVKRVGGWVPFGQGDVSGTGFFRLLRKMGYTAPVSMHIEFDWTDNGKNKTPTALIEALKNSARVLRGWLAGA